ncbi:MAG: thiol-disulfide oxidoreductase DCC family protein [Thiotrichales bacterium]
MLHRSVRPNEQEDSANRGGSRATVFYDGACPLCRREIAHYRRMRGAERMRWIDVASNPATLAEYGLDRVAAMARFHVLDRHGRWQTGAWGFAELWSQLPRYRWLARTLRSLRVLPLLDRLYTRFARWRLQRRCNGGSCDPFGQ